MGWYQDNFPGSPAQRQRTLFGRGVVIYTIVTGAAFYMFAPAFRRVRKEFEEGRVLDEPTWLVSILERKSLSRGNLFSSESTTEKLLTTRQEDEKRAREDYLGPDASDETLRSVYNVRK